MGGISADIEAIRWCENDFYHSYSFFSHIVGYTLMTINIIVIFILVGSIESEIVLVLILSIPYGILLWSYNLIPTRVGIGKDLIFIDYNIKKWNKKILFKKLDSVSIEQRLLFTIIILKTDDKRIKIYGLSDEIINNIKAQIIASS